MSHVEFQLQECDAILYIQGKVVLSSSCGYIRHPVTHIQQWIFSWPLHTEISLES